MRSSGAIEPLHGERRSVRQYNICISAAWARPDETTLLILALDTTTRAGSVAVLRDHDLLADLAGDPSVTHGQRLPGEVMRALAAAAIDLDQVELLAVIAGPGSFTGLRVGIATMQGLAFARGLRIVPVSTLEALGREAAREPSPALIAPWVDAQRQEVFATLFSSTLDRTVIAPSSARPADTIAAWRDVVGTADVRFIGDGAVKYRDAIVGAFGNQATFVDRPISLAATAARIAALEPDRGVLPHALVPIYVRRPDAELARERSTPR